MLWTGNMFISRITGEFSNVFWSTPNHYSGNIRVNLSPCPVSSSLKGWIVSLHPWKTVLNHNYHETQIFELSQYHKL